MFVEPFADQGFGRFRNSELANALVPALMSINQETVIAHLCEMRECRVLGGNVTLSNEGIQFGGRKAWMRRRRDALKMKSQN